MTEHKREPVLMLVCRQQQETSSRPSVVVDESYVSRETWTTTRFLHGDMARVIVRNRCYQDTINIPCCHEQSSQA